MVAVPITRLPAAPAQLLGVAMVRTKLTAFVDLDVLVAGRRTPRLERGRAVVIKSGGIELGVIADLRNLPNDSLRPADRELTMRNLTQVEGMSLEVLQRGIGIGGFVAGVCIHQRAFLLEDGFAQ